MTSSEEDTDDIGILRIDPGLEPYRDHFTCRVKRYIDQKALLEKHEGGLEEFALGG
jgi:1,4-alpha-glucan branching enzyme